MKEFLEQYKAKLTTVSPVYIGSGTSLTKKEYIFEPATNTISILNSGSLLRDFAEKEKADKLGKYFMKEQKQGLGEWFKENGIEVKRDWIEYEYVLENAAEIFADKKFRGIEMFQKDAYGNPYIPGSSLKGAIRTILLKYWVTKEQKQCKEIIKKISDITKKQDRYLMKNLAKSAMEVEKKALSKKTSQKDKNGRNVEYDIMKGFIISDSKPLSLSDLTLCQKIDTKMNGKQNERPILRECLKPGIEIEFTLAIDKTCFPKTIAEIEEALQYSSEAIQSLLKESFPCEQYVENNLIYLGGGAGYLSKTFTYDLLENEKALEVAKKVLPKAEGRDKDTFAPRVMKNTHYNGKDYEMGLCKIEFERKN